MKNLTIRIKHIGCYSGIPVNNVYKWTFEDIHKVMGLNHFFFEKEDCENEVVFISWDKLKENFKVLNYGWSEDILDADKNKVPCTFVVHDINGLSKNFEDLEHLEDLWLEK